MIAEADSGTSLSHQRLPDMPSHIGVYHIKLGGAENSTQSRGCNLLQAKEESKCDGDIFCFLQDHTRLPSRHMLDVLTKHQGSKDVLGFRVGGGIVYGCLAFPSAVVVDRLWTMPEDEWDIESLLLHKKLEKHLRYIETDITSTGRRPATYEECLQQQREIADMAKLGLLLLDT